MTTTVGTKGEEVSICDLRVSYRTRFRRHAVLKGAELTAHPGEVTAIVGANGAGKTTLFRALLGFLTPNHGYCSVSGLSSDQYRQKYGIGYLPESCVFPRKWSARDLLARGADLAVAPSDRPGAYAAAVARTGFDRATLSKPARLCSKGNKRRLVLAYALLGDPGLVVLDEPFSGLDPPSRSALRKEIHAMKSRSATVLLASHNLDEVGRLADRVFILKAGRTRLVEATTKGKPTPYLDLEAALLPEGDAP